jgi:hypothetical protein
VSSYQEAGKSIERGVARMNGEPVPDGLLPAPVRIERIPPRPYWRMIRTQVEATTNNLYIARVERREGAVVRLDRGDVTIEVDVCSIDELIDILRAAKIWTDS